MYRNIHFKYLAILFLHFLVNSCEAQTIMQDSRGKDVFEYYKAGSLQATFVPSQVSMQLNYNFVLGSPFYYYVNHDTTNKTVGKSYSISVVGKVSGSGSDDAKPFNIKNGLVRPSYRLEVGYQRNLNTFYNIHRVPKAFAYAWGISLYGEYENMNFYDTTLKLQKKERPFIFGAHSHITWFETQFGVLAISLSGDLAHSYNQEALVPFQDRTATTYIDPNIISVGDVLGNIGAFGKVTAYRLRLSMPIFLNNWISMTPYASVYGYAGSQSNSVSGFAINFFNGTPSKPNSSLVQGFGFGLDWIESHARWSKCNVSLSGSLDLDLLKKTIVGRAQ